MNLADQKRLLADVEAFCEEIRPVEELCYVEHRFNDQVLPLARKHNLLGMILPAVYSGRDADTVTYVRALTRIGREGTGVRTFFSGHMSIGEYPILMWGNDEQKRRYLVNRVDYYMSNWCSQMIIASGIVLKCGSPVRTRPDLLRAVAKTNESARPKSGCRFLCSAWSSPASLASAGTRGGMVELLSMASTAVLGSRRVLMNLLTTSASVTGEVKIEF